MDIKLILFAVVFTVLNIVNTSIIIKRTGKTKPCVKDCSSDRKWAIMLLVVSLLMMVGAIMLGLKKAGVKVNATGMTNKQLF